MRERDHVADTVARIIECVKCDRAGGQQGFVPQSVGVGLQFVLRGDIVYLYERRDAHVAAEGGLPRLRVALRQKQFRRAIGPVDILRAWFLIRLQPSDAGGVKPEAVVVDLFEQCVDDRQVACADVPVLAVGLQGCV